MPLILQLSALMCTVRCVEPVLNLSVEKHTNHGLGLCVYIPDDTISTLPRNAFLHSEIQAEKNPFAFILAST